MTAQSERVIEAFRAGRKGYRMLALAVLACAMLLRLLVPAGWMPVADAGGVHLTLCSGTGAMTMPMPMPMPMPQGHTRAGAGHHMPADQQGAPEHPCAFAHSGLAIAEPGLGGLLLAALATSMLPAGAATRVAIGRGLAAPPPPATGPPSIA